jgi:hypothetical protein
MAAGIFYVGYKKPGIRKGTWQTAIILVTLAILKLIVEIYSLTTYEASFLETKGANEYVFETSIETKIFLVISILTGAGILIHKHKLKGRASTGNFKAEIISILNDLACISWFLISRFNIHTENFL